MSNYKVLSAGYSYCIKVPLQVAAFFMINACKFFVEGMVSAYLVPRSLRLCLTQASYVFNFNDEDYAEKPGFKDVSIGLLITYIALDCLVVGARRLQTNYQFVTFNDKVRDKIIDAIRKLSTLGWEKKVAVIVVYPIFFILYYASLYIYGMQSQKEFIKDHPGVLGVKKWNNNPYSQNTIAVFLILASALINFFEGLHNSVVIINDKNMLFNRKAIPVLITSLTLAFMIRLFVVEYAKDNAIDSKVSTVMQILFVLGTIGFSLTTAGFSWTMDVEKRYIPEKDFKGKRIAQAVLTAYFILGAVLCQSLGNYHLLMTPLSGYSARVQKPCSLTMFFVAIAIGGVGMYLFVNYIKNQVYDSCRAAIKMASSRCGRQGLFADFAAPEDRPLVTVLMPDSVEARR